MYVLTKPSFKISTNDITLILFSFYFFLSNLNGQDLKLIKLKITTLVGKPQTYTEHVKV